LRMQTSLKTLKSMTLVFSYVPPFVIKYNLTMEKGAGQRESL